MYLDKDDNGSVCAAAPLFSVKGERIGIITVLYKADRFISLLSQYSAGPANYSYRSYLIREDGTAVFPSAYSVPGITDSFPAFAQKLTDDSYFGIVKKSNAVYIYCDILHDARQKFPTLTEKWFRLRVIDQSSVISFSKIVQNIVVPMNMLLYAAMLSLLYVSVFLYWKVKSSGAELRIARQISDSTTDAVLIMDRNTVITNVNSEYEKVTGYTSKELIGRTPSEFRSTQHDAEYFKQMWRSIDEHGFWEGTLWDKTKWGLLFPKTLKILAIREKRNLPVSHYISIFNPLPLKDNTANEKLLIHLLERNTQDTSAHFMVLSISIENFNQLINSQKTADETLISKSFSALIQPLLSSQDFIAQTGRSTFTVAVNFNKSSLHNEQLIEKIDKSIDSVIAVSEHDLFFKIKIGASFWPQDADNVHDLLLKSVLALEWAVSRQSNEYVFYSPEMEQTILRENKIEHHLKNAIVLNELYMVYQPQINCETGETIGAESLLRWNNAELGLVPPDEFIGIAEKRGLIQEIGLWILNQVCSDFQHIFPMFEEENASFKMAVNISAKQLSDSLFPQKAVEIIDSYKIPHHFIEFEITETLVMDNPIEGAKVLSLFRSLGFSIALDDFGTGYSSLSYLQKLPITKMKIDRCFIKDYPEHDEGLMIKLLVGMSKILGISILTEGVENAEQLEYLKDIGCIYIQGYYFSRPVKFDKFISFLGDIHA